MMASLKAGRAVRWLGGVGTPDLQPALLRDITAAGGRASIVVDMSTRSWPEDAHARARVRVACGDDRRCVVGDGMGAPGREKAE